jgi:nucleotide-binding universal stress UspA family protein
MESPTPHQDTVLAILDGSKGDQVVLEVAGRCAGPSGAAVKALVIVPEPKNDLISGPRRLEPWEQIHNLQLALGERALALAREAGPPEAEVAVVFGSRWSELRAALSHLDPILVVARPRPWWQAGLIEQARLRRAAGQRLVWATNGMPAGRIVPDSRELLRGHPLFSGLSRRTVHLAATNLDLVETPAHQVLIKEGRPNPAFWLLLEGSVAVSVAGERRRVIGRGGYVGGFSLLSGRPATATVTTLTPVRALAASAAQFRYVAGDETVRLRLKAAYADRFRDDLQWA